MTGKTTPIRYLSNVDIKIMYGLLSDFSKKTDSESLPPFSLVNTHDIDGLVTIAKTKFFGIEQYPTLESKASIIFYTINKKHIFKNGNKRMSTFCLLVFLDINKKQLNITQEKLTKKALWLAKTSSGDFHNIKEELNQWIRENIIDM